MRPPFPLQHLSFDEAMYQTFGFLTRLQDKMNVPLFTDTDREAVKRTVFILAQMIVEADKS